MKTLVEILFLTSKNFNPESNGITCSNGFIGCTRRIQPNDGRIVRQNLNLNDVQIKYIRLNI